MALKVGDKVMERIKVFSQGKKVGVIKKMSSKPFLNYKVVFPGSSEEYEYHRGELMGTKIRRKSK